MCQTVSCLWPVREMRRTSASAAAALLLLAAALAAALSPPASPPSLDCAMRRVAAAFASRVVPRAGAGAAAGDIAAALNLDACGPVAAAAGTPRQIPRRRPIPVDAVHVHVGLAVADRAAGGVGSIEEALALVRASGARTIVLHAGIHYLNETMVLSAKDSGLTIMGAPGEEAWISGGVLLQ